MSRKVPSGWSEIAFRDIASGISERNRKRDDIPVLSVTKYDGFVPSEEYFQKKVFSADTENYKIVRKGQFAYATIHLDEGSIDRLTRFDAGLISPMYTVFEVDEHIADPDYILRLFKLFASNGQFGALGNGGVNRRKAISFATLEKLTIALPPIHEQRRIAEVLSSVDEAIAATRAVIEQTRKVKQGVLERLLTKGIGHTRFKQTEIGEIPEGWETRALGDLAEFVNGRGFKPEEWSETGLPIIRIQNLNGGSEFNYFNGTYHPKLKVEQGDLLFAWSGSRGTSFGPHIWNGPKGLLNYHTWRVAVGSPKDRDFLYFALLAITKKIERDSHGASALVHMQKAYVVDYLIPYPPESERASICKILSEIDRSINRQATELERLISIKSALMSDLLTGRKRVTDALPMAAE